MEVLNSIRPIKVCKMKERRDGPVPALLVPTGCSRQAARAGNSCQACGTPRSGGFCSPLQRRLPSWFRPRQATGQVWGQLGGRGQSPGHSLSAAVPTFTHGSGLPCSLSSQSQCPPQPAMCPTVRTRVLHLPECCVPLRGAECMGASCQLHNRASQRAKPSEWDRHGPQDHATESSEMGVGQQLSIVASEETTRLSWGHLSGTVSRSSLEVSR